MLKSRSTNPPKKSGAQSSVIFRLDEDSQSVLVQAARLRPISLSEYVRMVTVPQARKEVQAAQEGTLALTPQEQLAFWNALNQNESLTDQQKKLGRMIRGEL
jgi:uncharacterized protein (DUF1778 family)